MLQLFLGVHLESAEPLLQKAKGAALSSGFPGAGSWNQAQIYELV